MLIIYVIITDAQIGGEKIYIVLINCCHVIYHPTEVVCSGKMAANRGTVVKSKVLFDYTKPELHGYLYKQGALHKAFKKRYFVLYPGYLVYYTDETKYRSDVAKNTLEVRC